MSVIICVLARKQLTETDFEKVNLYNDLVGNGYEPPEKLKTELETIFGHEIFEDELIPIPDEKQVIELGLVGHGSVMYGDGLVIPISALPANTIALRIYADG